MLNDKKKRLEKAGWKFGNAENFLCATKKDSLTLKEACELIDRNNKIADLRGELEVAQDALGIACWEDDLTEEEEEALIKARVDEVDRIKAELNKLKEEK